MTAPAGDGLTRLRTALAGVNTAAPSTSKFEPLEGALAGLLGLPAAAVTAATVSKWGNLSVRAEQSTRAQSAEVWVAVVPDPGEVPGVMRVAQDRVVQRKTRSILVLTKDSAGEWAAPWGVQPADGGAGPLDPLRAALGTTVADVAAAAPPPPATGGGPKPPTLPGAVPLAPLQLDPRVRRMLRLAVASRPAVMLVGPPGTGKSRLVAEIVQEVADDPAAFGMTVGHEVSIVTPDESWTARELVGGDTVDDQGRLRFATGAVLDALAQDRWLVLDEANRADMDRIFGSLLTWLAGQPVDVGRVSPDPASGPVRLGWADGPASVVHGADRLRADDPGPDPVDYLAGTEWRLLGTYNALDAQRVFRFGLALGRRFAHVPVPAPDRNGFLTAVTPYLADVPPALAGTVRDVTVEIYDAHRAAGAAALGPAVFLDIPGYVAAGAASGAPVGELLAEAYLTSLGTWLARLEDDELDRLAVTMAGPAALGGQWDWVRSQLDALR